MISTTPSHVLDWVKLHNIRFVNKAARTSINSWCPRLSWTELIINNKFWFCLMLGLAAAELNSAHIICVFRRQPGNIAWYGCTRIGRYICTLQSGRPQVAYLCYLSFSHISVIYKQIFVNNICFLVYPHFVINMQLTCLVRMYLAFIS